MEQAYRHARRLIRHNRGKFDQLVAALMLKGTLDESEVKALLGTKMRFLWQHLPAEGASSQGSTHA